MQSASVIVLTYPMEHFILLLIEFVDELVFGAADAAWPLIRNDLALNYVQIGLALSLPGFLADFIEPFIAIPGDVWKPMAFILPHGFCWPGRSQFSSVCRTGMTGHKGPSEDEKLSCGIRILFPQFVRS
jgi:hypothetical protein